MKKLVFLELLGQIRSRPNFKKKLKLLAVVGGLGLVVISTIVIFVGISVARVATHQLDALNVKGQVENLGARLDSLPAITTASCMKEAQSLMNFESWLTKPIAENFGNLKIACLEAKG
jgi:hypothetical protein